MLRWTMGCAAMIAAGAVAGAEDFCLVRDAKPVAAIVLPAVTEWDRYLNAPPEELEAFVRRRLPHSDEAEIQAALTKLPAHRKAEAQRVGDEEALAAEELLTYVEKITGARLDVVRWREGDALPTGPRIFLGAELARKAGFTADLEKLAGDGILLKRADNLLVLAGRRARGTLYAVYDFLESLGCRWIMPGPFGEFCPRTATLTTAVDKAENPSHTARYWWATYGHGTEYPRWTLRNKGNFVRAMDDPIIAQSHALGSVLRAGARDPERAIILRQAVRERKKGPDGKPLTDAQGKPVFETVEKDVTRLPDEYFALVNNKPNLNTPNMSNQAVWSFYAEQFRKRFGKDRPFDDYVSISAEDGLVLDDRPETRALDSNEYDWTLGAMSATDRLWFFHNRYVDEVLKVYPGRRFGVLVYSNNLMPPRIERVHPAMALVFAPLSICPLHDVRCERCKTNRAYRGWLEAWMAQARAAGAETYYYDYDPIGFSWNHLLICPQWPIVGRNYPFFYRLGLTGHTSQGFDDWGASGLNHWVMIRLYWNAEQDVRDVVRDYCRVRFGAAASAMMEYYGTLEKRMDEVPDLVNNEIWGNHLVLTPGVRAACREALSRALKAADTARAREQLAAVAALQRSTDAFCDAVEYARETGDFGGAAERMAPAFDVADELNAIYSHFVQPKTTSRETRHLYHAGGWLDKYRRWDARIKGSAAAMTLPRFCKIALDTDNTAWTKGWQRPEVPPDGLPDGDTTVVPDVLFGTERELAAFFYRMDVDVPVAFAPPRRSVIYFPSLIARAFQMWVNGTPVEFDHGAWRGPVWHGPQFFWINYDHQQSFDITGLLRPGERNTIAFRVFKSVDHGGSYDRIFLLADPPGGE